MAWPVRVLAEGLDPAVLPRLWTDEDLAAELEFSDALPPDVALAVAGAHVVAPTASPSSVANR